MGQSAAHINTLNNIKGQGLIHVVDLINGKMRGPKIHQCIKRMEYINKKSPETFRYRKQGAWNNVCMIDRGRWKFQVRTSLECKQPRLALSLEQVKASTIRGRLNDRTDGRKAKSVRENSIREDLQYRIEQVV